MMESNNIFVLYTDLLDEKLWNTSTGLAVLQCSSSVFTSGAQVAHFSSFCCSLESAVSAVSSVLCQSLLGATQVPGPRQHGGQLRTLLLM